jgi:ABC-type uncharacterized transport system substrate-binding protein
MNRGFSGPQGFSGIIPATIVHRCVMILMVLGILPMNYALAHPHNWVDVFAEWQFDQEGLITGVRMRWLFDDYYSVMLVEDARESGDELEVVRDRILDNVRSHHYFLKIEQNGDEAHVRTAEQARIELRGHRVEIGFHLPLLAPLDPRRGDVLYRIAEPTYYFEMLHAKEGPAIVLHGAPRGCRYHLEPPRPDAALVAYAAALGINESGGNDLGIQFAEKVTIQCE